RHASALDFMRSLEEHSTRLESRPKPEPSRQFISPRPSIAGTPAPPIAPREPKLNPTSTPAGAAGGAASATGQEWVFCGHCGEKIGGDDVYCAHCGQRQPSADAAAAASGSSPSTESRITAQLVVVSTTDIVKPFVINKESVLIGRTDPHTGIFPEIDL